MNETRLRLCCLLIILAVFAGCEKTPTSSPCPPFPDHIDTRTAFCHDDKGGGHFGVWGTDAEGRPAFEYDPSVRNQPRSVYYTTEENNNRRHWHMAGNGQTVAMFDNTGASTLYSLERGVKTLGAADDGFPGLWTPVLQMPNGSYTLQADDLKEISFLGDGVRYLWQHADQSVEAVLSLRRPVDFAEAPVASQLYIRASVQSAQQPARLAASFALVLEQQLFTGAIGGSSAASIRQERRAYYQGYPLRITESDQQLVLQLQNGKSKHLYGPSGEDSTAPTLFLWSDRTSLWQWNGRDLPVTDSSWDPSAVTATWQAEISGNHQTSQTYRFAIGYEYRGLRWPDGLTRPLDTSLPAPNADILFGSHGQERRELWWHSQSLMANIQFDQYFNRHMINQGSAYGYYEGVNGAPRDFVLAANPLNHLLPQVARETLETILHMTRPDGQIMYALFGVGQLDGLVIHEQPSDPDIFLLWGAAEYLGRTRDMDWLNTRVPFYTQSTTGSPVLQRLKDAFAHLRDVVGIGTHGLIRLRDGDWSDGILLRADDPSVARKEGESTLNSAMVAALFPRLADVLQRVDAPFADEVRLFARQQFNALQSAWNGQWYLRGYESKDKAIGDKEIFLEPQVFALLALHRFGQTGRARKLIATVQAKLAQPSQLGPWLVWPADEFNAAYPAGWDVNGGSWHAMNGIWIWALSKLDPEAAMTAWQKASMRQHALAYPDIWYGIWSGPDSFNADYAERPGETFYHLATPMTDFPTQNSNQHALPLWSAIAGLAGIEFGHAGLIIDTTIAGCPQRIKLTDIQLYCNGASGELRITPSATGYRTDRLILPMVPEAVRGIGVGAVQENNTLTVSWQAVAGQTIKVVWGAQAEVSSATQ